MSIRQPGRLQPTQKELETTLENARLYWHTVATEALSLDLDQSHIRLELHSIPALPLEPLQTFHADTAVLSEASSSWCVASSSGCGIDDKWRRVRTALRLGVSRPIECRFDNKTFRRWHEAGRSERDTMNYVGILVLGWCYILSAHLVEIQCQEGLRVNYTGSLAAHCDRMNGVESSAATTIDIGEVNKSEARWWRAILAPNTGWTAIISQQNGQIYHTPWSASVEGLDKFKLSWQETLPDEGISDSTPPSSYQALKFLARFSSLHDLQHQYYAAFATALLFPCHHYHGIAVSLPFPSRQTSDRGSALSQHIDPKPSAIFNQLRSYIPFSCNPEAITSSLCGTFWEPHIPCNFVSPWLHPIIHEIPNGAGIINFPGRYHEILALICARRSPSIAALWLGAATSGLIPRILKLVESGTPPLDQNGVLWTGSPQSFMDIPGSGSYFDSSGEIERTDVWRLLYLPTVVDDDLYYESRPFSPWNPPGKTSEQACHSRVRAHRHCRRHELTYRYWTWESSNGSNINDCGHDINMLGTLATASIPNIKTDCSCFPIVALADEQDASQRASRTILQWVTLNGEGVPSEDIYQDKWVQGHLVNENDSSDSLEEEPITLHDVSREKDQRNSVLDRYFKELDSSENNNQSCDRF